MVWLPDSEKILKIFYSFWQNQRTWQTQRRTDTAWQLRPRLHSIAWQKSLYWQDYHISTSKVRLLQRRPAHSGIQMVSYTALFCYGNQ